MPRNAVLLVLLATLTLLAPTMSACDDGESSEPNDTQVQMDGADDVADDADDTTADTGDDAGDTEEDTTTLPDGPSVVFDKGGADDGDFFAFPYPSRVRTTSSGSPDLDALLDSPTPLAQSLLDEVGRFTGFSPQSPVYFQLEAAIDPASLPQTANATTGAEASAFVLNVEPDSPDYLRRHPVQVELVTEATSMSPANMLVLRPVPGRPLRTGEQYAAVLTRDIKLADGSPIGAVEGWESSKTSILPPPGLDPDVHAEVRQLLIELADAQLDVDNVLVATAFETSDAIADYELIYDTFFTDLLYTPPTTFEMVETTDDYFLFEGTVEWTEYVDLTDPTTPGSLLSLDAEGRPQPVRTVEVRFGVMTATFPAGGEPVFRVFISPPPAGGDHRTALDVQGPLAAQLGTAAISVEAPLVGSRNPGAMDPLELLDEISVSNPLGYRDLIIQAVADQIQLTRLAEILVLEAGMPFNVQVDFDPNPLVVTATGLHGQALALQAGSALDLDNAIIAQAGAGLGAMLTARTGTNGAFQGPLATALGASGDTLDALHPAVTLLLQPALDMADPAYVAGRAFRNPVGVPKDVLMARATEDPRVSTDSIEALAVAFGAPPLQPIAGTTAGYWEAAGIDPVSLPVQANINTSGEACVRVPCQVTAVVSSFVAGHDVFSEAPAARTQWLAWVGSALEGGAPLLEAPE